jgi:hypothetical protein
MDGRVLIQYGLENTKRSIDKALDGLTYEELKWQPKADANSIGLILFHIARSQDMFIQSVIRGKQQIWEVGKWYQRLDKSASDQGAGYTSEQVAAFIVPAMKDLLAYYEAVHQETLSYVNKLTTDMLDQKVTLPPMGPPPASAPGAKAAPPKRPPFDSITGSLLMMTVTHAAQHAGEICYIRGLQRGINK